MAELAETTGLALNTLKRAEAVNAPAPITTANAKLLVTLLGAAGVIFIRGGDGLGSGVRLADDDVPVARRRRNSAGDPDQQDPD
ncbi:transcriptional regulator [Brevundimonas naejangsanensis]|uniref:transcriptional regulator n=1 Tax=Brevundimonas naejangsanensis TaxID=588932 RepID=UPI0034D3D9EE